MTLFECKIVLLMPSFKYASFCNSVSSLKSYRDRDGWVLQAQLNHSFLLFTRTFFTLSKELKFHVKSWQLLEWGKSLLPSCTQHPARHQYQLGCYCTAVLCPVLRLVFGTGTYAS